MKRTPSTDLESIINEEIQDEILVKLNVALKDYMKDRKLDAHNTKDQVDLILVIFSMLDISEDEMMEFVSRLNLLQLKKMGMIQGEPQGNVH